MNTPRLSTYQPACYRLRLQGSARVDWSDWLDTPVVIFEDTRMTVTGTVHDQSALFGLLNFVRDMGMPLLLVEYLPDLLEIGEHNDH